MSSSSQYSIVLTTTSSKKDAEKIIQALLTAKLAACIQVYEIKSYYTWKEKINEDSEQLLLIKAKADLYPEIEASIKANHTYEIPEIIQVPIVNGSEGYLNWVEEVSKHS
jgi:periplasmic divalent cation tolerance protein